MSIDSTALTALNNAISSYSTSTTKTTSSTNDLVSTISSAAAEILTTSKYKTAFEEKMKTANSSDDTVDISSDSLAALEKYNKTGVATTTSTDSSDDTDSTSDTTDTSYTYDYATLKAKNQANLKAIEEDVASRYQKTTESTES